MFLLYAEVEPSRADTFFAGIVKSLSGVSLHENGIVRAIFSSAGGVLEAAQYLQHSQRPRRLVLADMSRCSISARMQMMAHVAQSVKFDFPVLVGDVLVQELSPLPGVKMVGLGHQRFEDLLPAEVLTVLVPDHMIGPRAERLGLALIDNNLPPTWDSFLGRGRELADCRKILQWAQVLTVKGCGGAGKTRFTQHLAAQLRHEGFELIRFIRLSDLPLGASPQMRFMETCRLDGEGLEQFRARYREKRTLVILDNCEHVLSGVKDLVSELLKDYPQLTVICTSREPLQIAGEAVYELAGLELVEDDSDGTSGGAFELFLDRYGEQRPLERISEDLQPTVHKIVHALDGLPLAIEHAAFRASVAGLENTLESLRQVLPRLKSDRSHYEPRQRTIAATIQWSFDLLTPEEQEDFLLLSILRSPFDHRDLAVVRGEEGAWESLMALHRKSMIRRDRVLRGHQFFRLLEVVSEYGRTRVSPEMKKRAENLWAERAAAIAQELHLFSEGYTELCSFEEGQIRYETLKSGLEWHFREQPPIGAEMTENLIRYWSTCGPFEDAIHFVREGLRVADHGRPRLLTAEGTFLWLNGKLDEAVQVLSAAARTCEQQGDLGHAAIARANLAALQMTQGDYDGAIQAYREAISTFVATGERARLAGCVVNLAQAQLRKGRPVEALETVERHEGLFEAGFLHALPHMCLVQADAYRALEDESRQADALVRGLQLCQGLDSADALPGLLLRAAVYLVRRSPLQARRLYGAAQQSYRHHGVSTVTRGELDSLYDQAQASEDPSDRLRLETEGSLFSTSQAISEAIDALSTS